MCSKLNLRRFSLRSTEQDSQVTETTGLQQHGLRTVKKPTILLQSVERIGKEFAENVDDTGSKVEDAGVRAVVVGELVQAVGHVDGLCLAQGFYVLLCMEEESLKVFEPEGNATHDALCRVACQEHLVRVLATANQQTQFSLCEILGFVDVELMYGPGITHTLKFLTKGYQMLKYCSQIT